MRTIIITGASRGIGRATALALANPQTRLVLAARAEAELHSLAQEVSALGASALVQPCDVRDEAQVRALIVAASTESAAINGLVNCAGTAVVAPFETISLADWQATLEIGLTGTFLTCKHVIGYMPAGALIVNLASVAARQAFANWSSYVAVKHALLGFSAAIREELRPRGIRVTVVLPAATDTTIWDQVPGDWNRQNMLQAADVGHAIAGLFDQPAYLTVEELALGHVAGRL